MMKKDVDSNVHKKRKLILLKIFFVFLVLLVVLFAVTNILWLIRDAKLKKLCTDKYKWEIVDDSDTFGEVSYSYDPENVLGEPDNTFSVSIPCYPESTAWITLTEALVLNDDRKTFIGDYAIDVQIKKHTFFPVEYILMICDLRKAERNNNCFYNYYYIRPDLSLIENKFYTYTDEEKELFNICQDKIKSQVEELEEFFGKPLDEML